MLLLEFSRLNTAGGDIEEMANWEVIDMVKKRPEADLDQLALPLYGIKQAKAYAALSSSSRKIRS